MQGAASASTPISAVRARNTRATGNLSYPAIDYSTASIPIRGTAPRPETSDLLPFSVLANRKVAPLRRCMERRSRSPAISHSARRCREGGNPAERLQWPRASLPGVGTDGEGGRGPREGTAANSVAVALLARIEG